MAVVYTTNTTNTFDQEWSTGLCACCGGAGVEDGCQTCLVSTFIPCLQYGWNSQKLAPGSAPFAGDCQMATLVFFALAYCAGANISCIIEMSTRQAIRKKYNLKGTQCSDFCLTWCCSPCSLCQEHYQLTGPHNAPAPKVVE